MGLKPVTVSQLNSYIKRILQTDPILGRKIPLRQMTQYSRVFSTSVWDILHGSVCMQLSETFRILQKRH